MTSTITVSAPKQFVPGDLVTIDGKKFVVGGGTSTTITVRKASWIQRLWFFIRHVLDRLILGVA